MADYWTHFSFAIPDLTEAEIAWYHENFDDEDKAAAIFSDEPDTDWGYLSVKVESDDDGLWIYSDESGDVDQAVRIVQAFLQAHRPDDAVGFEWSHDCSKMRLDAFGGGAAFITATDVQYINTGAWLSAQAISQPTG